MPRPRNPHHAVFVAGLVLAAAVVGLWLLYTLRHVLLMSAFAVMLAVVLNAPVAWLEQRRVPRLLGTILVFTGVIAVAALLAWLVLPRLVSEGSALLQNFPDYVARLQDRVEAFLRPYPQVKRNLPLDAKSAGEMLPSFPSLMATLGQFSLSISTAAAVILVLLAMVVYAVAKPRPLLQLYLDLFPSQRRRQAARAFARSSQMLVGWIWSNIIVGSIEAAAVGVVLGFLGIPGTLIWAALALFAELVPKVGIYLMAIPPVLVALANDPLSALWVALFYVAMNEIMSDLVTPRIRASAMDLHAFSVLFTMLAMAAAFGLLGALIATPITAVIKAYFQEFYPPARKATPEQDSLIDAMVHRQTPSPETEAESP